MNINDHIQSVLEDSANNSGTYDENRDLENESENDNSGGDAKNDKEEPEEPQGENDNCAGDDQEQEEETGDPQVNAEIQNVDEKGKTFKC
ncbi:hypothetical protein L1987_06700 [Smallanthus sonchifolius]|uniref:Uncharacterized protein n=1 Tax=Smallanthus sonchifolius TaxID=185202 RepID=A0ACB9JYW5_9ASTR|nr:hypothetical protein L1987_06700 [Smallanthus sonchifolius]